MGIFSAFEEKPTDIHFASQEKDENIIFVMRRDFITNIPWIFFGLIFAIAPFIYMSYVVRNGSIAYFLPSGLEQIFLLVWILISFAYIIESFLKWYYNIYIVTDQRVIDVDFNPLFYKKISETTYDRIEDSSFTINGLFATIFNYGDVFIQTAGGDREFDFLQVPNPSVVQDKISDLAAAEKKSVTRVIEQAQKLKK